MWLREQCHFPLSSATLLSSKVTARRRTRELFEGKVILNPQDELCSLMYDWRVRDLVRSTIFSWYSNHRKDPSPVRWSYAMRLPGSGSPYRKELLCSFGAGNAVERTVRSPSLLRMTRGLLQLKISSRLDYRKIF